MEHICRSVLQLAIDATHLLCDEMLIALSTTCESGPNPCAFSQLKLPPHNTLNQFSEINIDLLNPPFEPVRPPLQSGHDGPCNVRTAGLVRKINSSSLMLFMSFIISSLKVLRVSPRTQPSSTEVDTAGRKNWIYDPCLGFFPPLLQWVIDVCVVTTPSTNMRIRQGLGPASPCDFDYD
ncbi:unnamed protein product [Hydatigera taeniaeformis]|uniref:Uncharacterized protein n=1 Tax=Hydatigena taeniaeformis TaxID=6205 RepID=A0A0R3X334_HYDTA|nr:unnamed protein product [Hydatigera taeniaeformis]